MQKNKYKISCDMDGVLTDFQGYFKQIVGVTCTQYCDYLVKEQGMSYEEMRDCFWILVHNIENFWFKLPYMPYYYKLWAYIDWYKADILTAVPTIDWETPRCMSQKKEWVDMWIGNVEVTFAYLHPTNYKETNKHEFCRGSNHILIDDSEHNIKSWEKVGGIGILHTSIDSTIQKLKILGL